MSTVAASINQNNTALLAKMTKMYPALDEWMKNTGMSLLDLSNEPFCEEITPLADLFLQSAAEQKHDEFFTRLTREEFDEIIQKLKELATLRELNLDNSTKLYVEQQISDITGLGVSFAKEGYTLPVIGGILGSDLHPFDVPDTDKNWPWVPHAKAHKTKPHFVQSHTKTEHSEAYRYTVTIPLQSLPQWQEDPLKTKAWFSKQKIILINPFSQIACIASVLATGPDYSARYRAMVSPALSRELHLWSFESQGHAVLLFVDDPDTKECGVVSFAKPNQE